ncbi:uncharacterized protein [Aristolochia californica]|uniref:uncharacterized protein n=1 Tax=Aristolochia californica TaxID=171875 RepID=UPI0035DE0CE4
MISSKVVLTYQRKRSSARVEAGHGTESNNPHSDSPVNIPVNTLSSSNESSTKDLLVNRKGDGEGGSNGQLTDSASSESTDSRLSGLLQVQDPRRRELKCLSDRSDVGQITHCSHKLFLTPKCGQSASQTSVKESDSSWVKSSTEKNSAAECEGVTKSEKCCSETNYSAKSTSSFSADLHKKFRNPLITFSRRAKKKESISRSENQTCNSELSPKDVVLLREATEVNPLPVHRQGKITNEDDGGCKSSDTGTACEFTIVRQEPSTHVHPRLDHCLAMKAEPTGSVQEDYPPSRCDETSSLTCGMEKSFSAARDSQPNLPKNRACTGEKPRSLSMNEDETNLELSVAPPTAMNLDVNSHPADEVVIKRKKVEHCSSMLSMNILNKEEFPKCLSGEVLNEVFPLACRSPEGANSRIDFQRRIFPPLDQSQCKQNRMNSSLFPPHFLDLSLPINPGTPVESLQSSLRMFSPSSFSSQSNWMFKANQVYSSENLRAYTSMWSEEELDSLWIGVRRHGRNNWNLMLRDPKLHFSNWRTAEDLAEQWVREQSKLLNGSKHYQPMTLLKADLITCGHAASKHRSMPTLWNGTTETQLSLGDVYSQKNEAVIRRYPFHFAQPYSPPHMTKSSVLGRTELPQQKHTRGQRNRLCTDSKWGRRDRGLCDSQEKTADKLEMFNHGVSKRNLSEAPIPTNDDFSPDLQEKGNLPHWLREVASIPSRPIDLALPPNVSALTRLGSLFYNENSVITAISTPGSLPEPSKYPIKLPRKKNRISCRTGCLRVTERSTSKTPDTNGTDISWMETRLGLFPSVGSSPLNTARKVVVDQDQVENRSNQLMPKDPIVVDSDASSEETISDDQSGREC